MTKIRSIGDGRSWDIGVFKVAAKEVAVAIFSSFCGIAA
jgi:hypothetical protein